jgi:excisionase family DNA binding protein
MPPARAPAPRPGLRDPLTPAQAAELLKVTTETVWNYCKSPKLAFPHYRLNTKTIRIDRAELAAWIAARRWLGRIRDGERPAAPPGPPGEAIATKEVNDAD